MKIVLVGNQNSGKSTLFNLLTGGNAPVGNRAGVTVEKSTGRIKGTNHHIVDLPGTYSLTPYTEEEKITCDHLKKGDYDLIFNVVDATRLDRALSLTIELKSLNKPVIVIITMIEKAKKKGLKIDTGLMSELLGLPVVSLSQGQRPDVKLLCGLLGKGVSGRAKKTPDAPKDNYRTVDGICALVVSGKKTKSLSDAIDKIVLNKYLAFPVFGAVMLLVYSLSVGVVGRYLSALISSGTDVLRETIISRLLPRGVNTIIISLLSDGIVKGMGAVISFLPQLAVLFTLLSLLEGTGYMSRAAFIFYRAFKKIGLSGKSIIPFIVGTGCSVPAVLSTRTIEKKREKTLTAILTPFVPCSAKLPIIALFAGQFFPKTSGAVTVFFYFSAVAVIIVSATIINAVRPPKGDDDFLYELTDYALPSIKNTFNEVIQRLLSFLKRVGTTVFVCSLLVWALTFFSPDGAVAINTEESVLAHIGKLLSPLLYPVLGVNSWQATVSALQGLIAKEQVVSSMYVISGLDGAGDVFSGNSFAFFDKASALAFVSFNLFSPPCISAITTLAKETGIKKTAFAVLMQFTVAMVFSTVLRLTASLFLGS